MVYYRIFSINLLSVLTKTLKLSAITSSRCSAFQNTIPNNARPHTLPLHLKRDTSTISSLSQISLPPIIPSPKSLSPSSAMEFLACPQSYLFQYLYGIKQPTNLILAKGTMCHSALEQIYDLSPADRTLSNLQNVFRKEWSSKRFNKPYETLFRLEDDDGEGDRDFDAEREWGLASLELLKNYVQMEDPSKVESPNPMERERWVTAYLSLDPTKGVTGYTSDNSSSNQDEMEESDNDDDGDNKDDTFLVRGIIDRLDLIRFPSGEVGLRVIDYKTGKTPNFKYSQKVNERIAWETFWQLRVYAMLLRETSAKKRGATSGVSVRFLRLMYLGDGQYLDMDLGETEVERDGILQEMHGELVGVWERIGDLVEKQDKKGFVHCERPFCWCHKVRPNFDKGTFWERT